MSANGTSPDDMRICDRCGYYNSSVATRCERCGRRLSTANEEPSYIRRADIAETAPPEAAQPQTGGVVRYGGFWERFAAFMIDSVIVGFGLIVSASFPPAIALLLAVVGPAIYEIGAETRVGATPGKRLLGLRVVSEDLQPVSMRRSVVRYVGHFISAFFLIGYLMPLFNQKKRALHDYIAGTVVIKAK